MTKSKPKPYTTLLKIFAGNMRSRFRTQASRGMKGWDDPEIMDRQKTIDRIVHNLNNDTANGEVDAANLCLFLWNLRKRK